MLSIKQQKMPLFENKHMPLGQSMKDELNPHKLVVSDVRFFPIVSIGSKNTGVHFHQHDENFVAQLAGRKMWFLGPPETDQPVKLASPCDYDTNPPDGLEIARCMVHPGDILYLPGGVWHATCNMDLWTFGFGGQGLVPTGLHQAYVAIIDKDFSQFKHAVMSIDDFLRVPEQQEILGKQMSLVRWLPMEVDYYEHVELQY